MEAHALSLITPTCEPSTDLSWVAQGMSRLFGFSFEKLRTTLTCEAATQVARTSESALARLADLEIGDTAGLETCSEYGNVRPRPKSHRPCACRRDQRQAVSLR